MISTGNPEKIRVSIGSASVMGLLSCKMDVNPTTAYVLMSRNEKCSANCSFCSQAKTSRTKADRLSRVIWPAFLTKEVVEGIEKTANTGKIMRVCIQSLNYPEVFDDVLCFVKEIRARVRLPISVSCSPLNQQQLKQLTEAGVNRVSIALDAATEEIFDTIKGRNVSEMYSWNRQHDALKDAVKVFGKGFVSTHFIVGLGETEMELCQAIQWCVDSGVYPALFAFTPIQGTALENNPQPQLSTYRRVQVAHYIIVQEKARIENMEFNKEGKLARFGIAKEQLTKIIETGEPFLTSGCSGCNRPYYNERPMAPFYNFPRQLLPEEIEKVKKVLGF